MNLFHDLFRQPTRKVDGVFPSDKRSELFPDAVARSRKLHLWKPGEPTSEFGPRLLIGVAVWSGYDMNLLDSVEDATHSPVRIDVFDIDTCLSEAGFAAFIPALPSGGGIMPPLAGLWTDGRFVESAFGHSARELVARVCGLGEADINSRIKTVYSRL